jgi:hypothetical protein
MQEDDDVTVDKAVPFYIVLGDEATKQSDMQTRRERRFYLFGPEVVMKV